jgi:hypothetical protein
MRAAPARAGAQARVGAYIFPESALDLLGVYVRHSQPVRAAGRRGRTRDSCADRSSVEGDRKSLAWARRSPQAPHAERTWVAFVLHTQKESDLGDHTWPPWPARGTWPGAMSFPREFRRAKAAATGAPFNAPCGCSSTPPLKTNGRAKVTARLVVRSSREWSSSSERAQSRVDGDQ